MKKTSTLELYGVAPSVLADMEYLEALKCRLSGLNSTYNENADKWFQLVKSSCTDYTVLSEISNFLKYLDKAKHLTNLQIVEVSSDDAELYSKVSGLPTTYEVYGINPIKLCGLKYSEALQIKLSGVKNFYNKNLKELIGLYKANASYEAISAQNFKCNYILKALKLTEFQIQELKE